MDSKPQLVAAPLEAYSAKDQAFFKFWYGHMLDDLMQPPLCSVDHATARYIWDAALSSLQPAQEPVNHLIAVELAGAQSTIGHLSQRVDEAVALATEAVELMTRFHSHAEPDDTPDMNAVFPALHFRNFVDDHARLMFKLNSFVRNPVEPAFLRLKKAADLVCAVMGAHGEISARDDRVSALMDCLYETDPLKSVYAESADDPALSTDAQKVRNEALEDAAKLCAVHQHPANIANAIRALQSKPAGKDAEDAEPSGDPCPVCYSRNCNGECMGDGGMGG